MNTLINKMFGEQTKQMTEEQRYEAYMTEVEANVKRLLPKFQTLIGETIIINDLWEEDVTHYVTITDAEAQGELIHLKTDTEALFDRPKSFEDRCDALTGLDTCSFTEIGAMTEGYISIAPYGW